MRCSSPARCHNVFGRLHRSAAVVSATLLALGGLGMAVGNVVLARILPSAEYANVALLLALTQLGITLGPLGWPTLINRHGLTASAGLLARTLISSVSFGLLIAASARAFYNLGIVLAMLLVLTVTLAAANRVAAALFQSRQAFGTSLLITQIHNWVLLASVPILLTPANPTASTVAGVAAFGYLITNLIAWRIAWVYHGPSLRPETSRQLFTEGLSIVGSQVALSVMFQLDRLVIPRVLSLEDLATYSVVAAVAGSAFRMLQTGTGFALLPRLRACNDPCAARRLIRSEASVVLLISVIAATGVIVLMPLLAEHLLAGRYEIRVSLVVAITAVGFIRVWDGFAATAVTALGSSRELMYLSLIGWGAVLCGLASAWFARNLGLVAVVYGLGAGWLLHSIAASMISVLAMHRLARGRPARGHATPVQADTASGPQGAETGTAKSILQAHWP
jgi:O-antigen/teichoic acid export membrane protein